MKIFSGQMDIFNFQFKKKTPLWSRDNVVASHAAGPGSIPDGVSFLVEVFLGFFLNCKIHVRKSGPHSFPDHPVGHHNHPKPYSSTDGDGL